MWRPRGGCRQSSFFRDVVCWIGLAAETGLQVEGCHCRVEKPVVRIPLLDGCGLPPVCLCHAFDGGDGLGGEDGGGWFAVSELLRGLAATLAREIKGEMGGLA